MAQQAVYTITVGQALRKVIEDAVKDIGGTVLRSGLDGSSTLVHVRASFPSGYTAAGVQASLFLRVPGPAIHVE